MLLHRDQSRHRWFQDQRWYDLIEVVDDASSETYYAQLVEEESRRTVMAALKEVIERKGPFLCALLRSGEPLLRDTKSGRADIEQFYREIFKDQGAIDSENTVEFARLISPDLLVVHGRFRPDTGKPEWPFVQMRVKQGDSWLMSKLWLFLSPQREGES